MYTYTQEERDLFPYFHQKRRNTILSGAKMAGCPVRPTPNVLETLWGPGTFTEETLLETWKREDNMCSGRIFV